MNTNEGKGTLIPLNQYHVGLYWCAAAAAAAAIPAALAGTKDTETQGKGDWPSLAHIVKVDKLAAGRRETCHQ